MRESFQPCHPLLTGCWSSPGSRRRRWRCWCRPRARPPARSPRPSWRGRPAPWGAGACPGRGRGRPGARPRHPSTRPCRPRPPHTASRGAARTWAANRHVSQVVCDACHAVTLWRPYLRPSPSLRSARWHSSAATTGTSTSCRVACSSPAEWKASCRWKFLASYSVATCPGVVRHTYIW